MGLSIIVLTSSAALLLVHYLKWKIIFENRVRKLMLCPYIYHNYCQ